MSEKVLQAVSTFGSMESLRLRVKSAGYELIENPFGRRLTAEEVISIGKDCVGIVSGLEPLSRDVLSALPKLRCISRVGVGADNVDKVFAKERGIDLRVTPDAPTQSVIEFTIGAILALVRHIPKTDGDVRKGEWKRLLGVQIQGRTVGVIGLGRIGKGVAALLVAMGAKVVGSDPVADTDVFAKNGIKIVSLKELLALSDIVTIHVTPPAGSPPVLGQAELNSMKKGSYLINMARGGIVDETALVAALKSGALAGAALDVFEQEPYKGPLAALENVLLSPHVASHTAEARERMETESISNLLESLSKSYANAR